MNIFGEHLFILRHKRKLLQKQIALDAGIDPSYITSLERGRRDPPRGRILEQLMNALAVTKNERKGLMQAAALSRIAKILNEQESDLPGATQLLRFALLIPALKPEELASFVTLAEGLANKRTPQPEDLIM